MTKRTEKNIIIFMDIIFYIIVAYTILNVLGMIIMMILMPEIAKDIFIWVLFGTIGFGMGYIRRMEVEKNE